VLLRAREWAPEVAIGLLAAALGAQRLVLRATPSHVAYPLVLLCGLGIAAAILIARLAPLTGTFQATASPTVRYFWPSWGGAYLGVLLAAFAARDSLTDPQSAQWVWLVAVVLPLVPLVAGSLSAMSPSRFRHAFAWPTVALGTGLFVLALVVRGVDITGSPSFVHVDEANCGLSAEAFMHGASLLSLGFFNLPMMSYAYLSLGLHLFSDPVAGIRWPNAVLGSVGVLLLFLLGKELFGRRVGAIAAVLLGFAFLHVEFSRDGIHNIQAPTAFTATMLLLVLVLRRGGALTAVLLGLMCAVDLQVYWAARVATLCAAVYVAYYLFIDRDTVLSRWQEAIWALLGFLIGFVPVFALFHWDLTLLLARERQLSLFTSDFAAREHFRSLYGAMSMPSIIWLQLWRTASTFNYTPDASPQIGWPGPMLDWIAAALLPASVAFATLNIKRRECVLVLFWAGSLVAAGAISADPPWWPRLLAMLPAALLLIALLLDRCIEILTRVMRGRRIAWAWVAMVIALSCIANLRAEFWDFPAATAATSERESTLVARFLTTAPGADNTVLLSNPTLYITFQTIQFIAPRAAGCTVLFGQALSSCPEYRSSRLFIALPDRLDTLRRVEALRPGGQSVLVGTAGSDGPIWAYELP
jgi:hypothetical protein